MPRAPISVGLSAALHVAAVALLVARPIVPRRPSTPLQIAVVERPPPETPTPAVPPRPAPPPPQRPRLLHHAPPPPPSTSMKAPEPTPEPEVSSGIAPDSTAESGNFAVPTGNTLYAPPPARAPQEVKPYAAERYALAATLTELPRLIAQPDLRHFYPPEARRKQHEGSVVLRLWLDATGAVERAELISNPGDGLGEAALRAARELRFSPAKLRGEPVATSVPFTLHFVLR